MKTRAHAQISKYFTGKALAKIKEVTDGGIDAQSEPDFEVLDGGADSMTVASADRIDSSTVRITGTLRTWSKVAQVQGDKIVPASPSNIVDYVATLAKNPAGEWVISQYDWSFHPGSEP